MTLKRYDKVEDIRKVLNSLKKLGPANKVRWARHNSLWLLNAVQYISDRAEQEEDAQKSRSTHDG